MDLYHCFTWMDNIGPIITDQLKILYRIYKHFHKVYVKYAIWRSPNLIIAQNYWSYRVSYILSYFEKIPWSYAVWHDDITVFICIKDFRMGFPFGFIWYYCTRWFLLILIILNIPDSHPIIEINALDPLKIKIIFSRIDYFKKSLNWQNEVYRFYFIISNDFRPFTKIWGWYWSIQSQR